MGIGGISIWQLLIVLLIIVMVFGTKKLRNMGSDLGAAVKGFRKGMEEEKNEPAERLQADTPSADPAHSPSGSESAEQRESSSKN